MSDTVEQTVHPAPAPPTQKEGEGEERAVEDLGGALPIDVADFFPEVNDDVSEVTWGHRVNSLAELEAMVEDPKIMMLEADVLLGHYKVKDEVKEGEEDVKTPAKTAPIMAHPPHNTSDLTFTMWLDKVITANQNGKKKGIKLDFKELVAVKECLEELNARKEKITFPVWLNADILQGPIDSPITPVPADEFLSLCADHFAQATLSLGWTTHLPPSSTGAVAGGYTRADVERMVEVLETHSITQPTTFPIRAALLPNSLEALEWLVDTVPDSTITIWSSEKDPFDPMAIVTLRDLLGPDAVFLDLPAAQMTQYQEVMASSATSGTGARGDGKYSFLPNSVSVMATVGMVLASALAALYLYE